MARATDGEGSAVRAGMIGLGQIGTPMAQRVAERGFDLAVRDVRDEAAQVLGAAGATVCASPSEVASNTPRRPLPKFW